MENSTWTVKMNLEDLLEKNTNRQKKYMDRTTQYENYNKKYNKSNNMSDAIVAKLEEIRKTILLLASHKTMVRSSKISTSTSTDKYNKKTVDGRSKGNFLKIGKNFKRLVVTSLVAKLMSGNTGFAGYLGRFIVAGAILQLTNSISDSIIKLFKRFRKLLKIGKTTNTPKPKFIKKTKRTNVRVTNIAKKLLNPKKLAIMALVVGISYGIYKIVRNSNDIIRFLSRLYNGIKKWLYFIPFKIANYILQLRESIWNGVKWLAEKITLGAYKYEKTQPKQYDIGLMEELYDRTKRAERFTSDPNEKQQLMTEMNKNMSKFFYTASEKAFLLKDKMSESVKNQFDYLVTGKRIFEENGTLHKALISSVNSQMDLYKAAKKAADDAISKIKRGKSSSSTKLDYDKPYSFYDRPILPLSPEKEKNKEKEKEKENEFGDFWQGIIDSSKNWSIFRN